MFADSIVERIPVELNVVGCPLSFHMYQNLKDDFVLHFGSHLKSFLPLQKHLRVNNHSGCGKILKLFKQQNNV